MAPPEALTLAGGPLGSCVVERIRDENRVMALDVSYVRSGGVAIAYLVVGEGEVDLVYVPDFVSNLVYGWESRHWRDF